MQDTREGVMREIPPELLARLAGTDRLHAEDKLRTAMEPVIPRAHQGAILAVDEIVDLKGHKFRVHAITERRVYLEPCTA